jgi:glycolate oxidase FAD binding subunit
MTVAELQRRIAASSREGRTIEIQGGNTLRGFGALPAAADAVVTTTKLNRLLAHEHHDLTCSVQSGMRIASFDDELARHGQFVPIDAPLRRKATVGGSLAAGWLGPRRHAYGRARDFVIGSQVVLADGTLANAGGMVVKNVSGYDMNKLYVGSFGTLGVITQLNFKTLPSPPCRRALIAKLPERTRSRAAIALSGLSVLPAAAFCVEGFRKAIDGEDGIDGRAYVLLEGSAALVDRATRDIRSALGRAGVPETLIIDTGAGESFERVLDATIANLGERSITYRVLGLPAEAIATATALRDAANGLELFTETIVDVMNADIFLRVSDRNARSFAEKIERADDALRAIAPRSVIAAGDAPIRASLNAWGAQPPGIETMRALKSRFDPNAVLNRGRFAGFI